MELQEAYNIIEKSLSSVNTENGFKKLKSDEKSLVFKSEKGLYRIIHDSESNILSFDCSYKDKGEETEYNTISKTLFEINNIDEKDAKYASKEIADEVLSLFSVKKQVNLDKVKMPKAVSRTKAKNGIISYDTDSLANRFGTLYPEMKDLIKLNIAENSEFLPEDFFINHGTPKVIDVIKNGSDAEVKKLFKMLNEVYEDGTNEVQDIIGVTILGEMKNNKDLMAVADKHMTDYMAGPVHEINKITAKKNKYTRKLASPPAYKPKKKKSIMASALQGGQK